MTSTLESYFRRVDAHLLDLNPEGRAAFLADLIEQWGWRYQDFQARVDRGQPTRGSMDAFDYTNTIAGLDQRAARNPTSQACADVRRWQEAYRTNREFHARMAAVETPVQS